MTIKSAEKECRLLSHTTKHSKDFAVVIKSGLSVDMSSMGRAYQFLNRAFQHPHINQGSPDTLQSTSSQLLFKKCTSFQMS